MHHNLYVARRENRMKQTEVAKKLMIHRVSYSRKECGKQDFTLNEAFILAKLFNTTVDQLFSKGEEN